MGVVLAWEDDGGALVSAVFDCDNQETHEFVTEITEHAVEEGADVADHARDKLFQFQLEGYVSDTPTFSNPGVHVTAEFSSIELQLPEKPMLLSASALIGAGIGAIGAAVFGAPAAPRGTLLIIDPKSRMREALNILDEARKAKRLVRVITRLREYENMLMAQLTVTRSPEDGNGATFTLALKEVRFVSSETVEAPQPSEPIGKTKKSAGAKNAAEDAEALAKKKKSLVKSLVDGAGSYLDNGIGALLP